MKLTLTVMRDNKCVQTITLDPPKEATFGRKCASGLADKQFDDDRLSRQHFRISPEGDGWLLQDLKSLNGTRVSGNLVNSCILKHEDEITAGMLAFHVNLVGTSSGAVGATSGSHRFNTPSISDPDGTHKTAVLASRGELDMHCSCERGESGQPYFRGDMVGVESAAGLLLALRQTKAFRRPWLIVDQSRLGNPLPESLAERAVPIVDWLSPEYAKNVSPRLINLNGTDFSELETLLDKAWGQDSIIVLFSDQPQSDLLQVLRKSVRRGTAITGVLWPSVLSYMLLKGQSGPAVQLMAACTSILMEFPDLPESWLLVGPPTMQKSLAKLGMVCTVPLEPTGTSTDS